MLYKKKNIVIDRTFDDIPPLTKFHDQLWFMDLQKLSNDELTRIYNAIATGKYEFAKNAWYIPLGEDKRCPIMIAKGHKTPDTLEHMAEFECIAKKLEEEYRRFIDAWDFGQMTKNDIKNAILAILQLRSIKIFEHSQ